MFLLIALGLTLVLALAAVLARDGLVRRLALIVLGFLVVSEVIYVDDSYSGLENRFNTTLKWWPWIGSASLLLLGPLALSAKGRAGSRGVVWLACLIPCTYLGVLVENWGWGDRQSVGHLEGHRFISKVPGIGLLLARLEREPRGVVIEDPRDAGSEGLASLPLYAGHRLWLGWDGYESLWRGFPEDVGTRRRRLVAFFEGALPEPSAWLEAEGIDYVLFYRATDTPERWQALNASIQRSHVWCEILILENRPVGYWKRRPPISSVGR